MTENLKLRLAREIPQLNDSITKGLNGNYLSGWLAILPAGAVQVEDNPVLLQMAREELIPMGTLRD